MMQNKNDVLSAGKGRILQILITCGTNEPAEKVEQTIPSASVLNLSLKEHPHVDSLLNPKISAHTFEKTMNKKLAPFAERALRDFHIEKEKI